MQIFVQTTSISKKLGIATLAVAALLLFQLVIVFLSNEWVLKGLEDLHQQEQLLAAVDELHKTTDSLIDLLDKTGTREDTRRIFNVERAFATKRLEEARSLAKGYSEYSDSFDQIEDALNSLISVIDHDLNSRPENAGRDLYLSKQFGLNAAEGQERLSLLIQHRSNDVFEKLYRIRYRPIYVAVAFTLSLIAFSLSKGLTFKRKVNDSIGNLVELAKEVTWGNLDFQAPIVTGDEIGALTDVFNRMTRELKASTVSRDYIETIIQSLPDAVFVLSHDARIRQINRASVRILGRNLKELVDQPIKSLFEPSQIEFGQGLKDAEALLRGKTKKIPVLVSTSVLLNRQGWMEGLVCSVKDISEQKQIETERRRLEESHQILSWVSSRLSESIYLKTTIQNILSVIVPKFGDCCFVQVLDKENPVDATVDFRCSGPDKDAFFRSCTSDQMANLKNSYALSKATRTGKSVVVESNRFKQDFFRALGANHYVVCPLVSQNRVIGTLTIISTESERKYTPTDLKLLEEIARRGSLAIENSLLYHEAQEAVRTRDEFLSIASHELRTPLTSLSLNLQLLDRELQKKIDSPSIHARATRIVSISMVQSQRLAVLLDELLDLTRIRLGRLELAKEYLDLVSMIRDVLERFKLETSQKNISISVQMPEHALGLWDRNRIDQVITNLLSNAIKYGNGKAISVSVISEEVDRQARIIVSDHGQGIPPEMHEKIFERFERAGVTGKKISGLGLGLYICRQIVEAHGGSIHVESEVGKGSSFVVMLPFKFVNERASNNEPKAAMGA